jgi:hypothetical protein
MLQARLDIADAPTVWLEQLMAGMAHIDAEHVRTSARQLLDHGFSSWLAGPRVARIFTRLKRLIA